MYKPDKENAKIWGQILARAWSDEAFKHRLLTHPKEVLKEYGISLPNDQEPVFHENTPKIQHFILPEKPNKEIAEEDLKRISGGGDGGDDYYLCLNDKF